MRRLLIALAAASVFAATAAVAQEDPPPPPEDQSQPADDGSSGDAGASGYQYDDLGETGAVLPPGFDAGVTAAARRWCGEDGTLMLTRLENLGGGGAIDLPRAGWSGEVQWQVRSPTSGYLNLTNGSGDLSFTLFGRGLQVRGGNDTVYLNPC